MLRRKRTSSKNGLMEITHETLPARHPYLVLATERLPANGLIKRYDPARRYIAPVDELLPSR